MILSSRQQKTKLEERLRTKTVEQMFLSSIQEGANCPPFVARAILEVAKSTFNLTECARSNFGKIKPGQMKVLGVAASEPAGKSLKECSLAEAIITLDAGLEDQVTRLMSGKNAVTALRRKRLLRIATEALEQNVLLTREDMSYRILNCGMRTINPRYPLPPEIRCACSLKRMAKGHRPNSHPQNSDSTVVHQAPATFRDNP